MKKKTVLFFSRCELVNLYGSLHEHLKSEFNVVHVAYSKFESDILINTYAISNVINFKNEIDLLKNYKPTDTFFEELDRLFLQETMGRFNLNGSIQSDRTFQSMKYEEVLKITAIYFKVWERIFSFQKVDFFIHEPTSLMLNHIASVFCKNQGGVYSTHIMVQGESLFNFIMVDHDNGYPTEFINKFNTISDEEIELNKERIHLFLKNFRTSFNVFFDVIGSGKPSFRFYIKIFKSAIKEQLLRLISKKKTRRFTDNVEHFLMYNRLNSKRIKNFIEYRKLKYDEYVSDADFYFFPLHLEPEAVVLYWADGVYSNQVKIIENIAAQLPPNIMLYVKDHPHLYGYRDLKDYERIQNIPNVKLLAPQLPGKKIVNDSKGVITLNGTAGLEALLLNKQIITFGSAFYNVSSRVKYVRDIKDFRTMVYSLKNVVYEDDDELRKFIIAFLKSQKNGFTDFYGNVAKEISLDMKINIQNTAFGLAEYFRGYENFKNSEIANFDFNSNKDV